VALAAFDACVFSLQHVSCQGVIELVPVKADHLKIPAMMVIMTGGTLFSLYFRRSMITPVFSGQGCNFLVAIQAFLIGDLFSQYMAFDAVGHPFQMGMGPGKVPGTELCQKRPGWKGQEDQGQPCKEPDIAALFSQNPTV
jgi:hypothetical protein